MYSEERRNELTERLERLRGEVDEAAQKSGRNPGDMRIVAVSKLHPADDIAALFAAGHADFGENYVQEAQAKQEALPDPGIQWHFIGGLQTNKAKFVAGKFALVHSVDSLKLAQALDRRTDRVQDVLLQVNVAHEEQKCGVDEADLPELAEAVAGLENLRLRGLMLMPPFLDDPEEVRPFFARLRELRDGLQTRLGLDLPELSMGMTGDFIQAVEEGATLVRVGTRIFGPRPCALK